MTVDERHSSQLKNQWQELLLTTDAAGSESVWYCYYWQSQQATDLSGITTHSGFSKHLLLMTDTTGSGSHDWHNRQRISWLTQQAADLMTDTTGRTGDRQALLLMTDTRNSRSARHYYPCLAQQAIDRPGITIHDWHSRQQICLVLLLMTGTTGSRAIRH